MSSEHDDQCGFITLEELSIVEQTLLHSLLDEWIVVS